MPVHGRPKEPWGRRGLIAAALALVTGAGCWDLSIPTVPPNPPPPTLNVLAPKAGDTIALTGEVSVQADSVYGVNSVIVLCGPLDGGARQAYAWGSPPFVALVDFSVCQGLTLPNPDGGNPILQLSVQAVTTAGADAGENLQVFLDATGPAISVAYPPTAQPKSPFVVLVTPTDPQHPLGSFPVVLLAGAPADRITSIPNPDGGPPTYEAFFASTPGIGIDNYDGGQPVPIEVLTDTDEVVRLSVDATGLNGNTTAIDLSVGLSRLVWDRYIPGQPAASSPINWAAEPVAFVTGLNGGLVLPLATSAGGGATAQWIPGTLSFADGTFYGFDVTTIGGLDGGYLARGLNAQGQTLFFDFTGNSSNLLLAPAPPATGPVVTATLTMGLPSPPLTSVTGGDGGPDLLCLQDTAQVCSATPQESLTCLTTQLTPITALSSSALAAGPDAGVVAGAAGYYLSPNVAVCGASWNLVDLTQGTISFGPVSDPNGPLRACAISRIGRLLAVGDGTFVVQLVSTCDVTGQTEYPILRVGSGPANGQSAILGAYTAPLGTPRLVQREVVGVLADGRVVTLTNTPPNTTFELWSLYPAALTDAGVASVDIPDVTSPVAGLYDSADATEDSVVARSVHSGADGTFAVLLSGAPLGVGVLAFGPGLSPLWLYLYPRVTSTPNARLVSASSVGDVYLVDEFNNRAASLRVRPPGQGGVQAPSGLAYSTNPAVYTKGTPIALNVPSYSGGAPTGYAVSPALPAGLSLNTTTGGISGTPTTVTSTASYTVTASNAGGSATVSLTITVNDAAPSGLTYSTNPAVYTQGIPIAANTPTYTGGTPTAYGVSPVLPAGLSLDPATGIISGTPSAVVSTAVYTVTASNPAGSTTVSLTITVNAAAVDAGPCTYCLTVTPSVVQITPNNNIGTAAFQINASAPAGYAGVVTVTGQGSGGSLVAPPNISFPNTNLPNTISFMPSFGPYPIFVTVYSTANAVIGQTTTQTLTGVWTAGGPTDTTVSLTIEVVVATVQVSPPGVTLPATTGTQSFTAEVIGPSNTAVTWQVDEAGGGTLSSLTTNPVTYTAPATMGTYHLRATSVAYPTIYAEATITVVGG